MANDGQDAQLATTEESLPCLILKALNTTVFAIALSGWTVLF